MEACPTHFRPQLNIRRARAGSQTSFASALAASLFLHWILASSFTDGPPTTTPSGLYIPVITATLESPAAVQSIEPAPAPEPNTRASGLPQQAKHAPPAVEPFASAPANAPQAASEASSLRDATYYALNELDVYPALASALDLRGIRKSEALGASGSARLLVMIDDQGIVSDVTVLHAEPKGLFEEDARRALLSTRFIPARKQGRPVKSRILVHLETDGEPDARDH